MGHEKTLTGLTVALAGASLIYGAGMIDSGVTFDCGQLLMDNEWAKMIRFLVGGFAVNDDTLLTDETKKVGPFGDFLSLPSTYAHMRDQSQPQLMERRVREEWANDGSTSMYERARAKARELLESHRPDPIDADVAAEMRAFVQKADEERGVA
jgi:trimethylamine---corrinoid protein Co-methyltransferase